MLQSWPVPRGLTRSNFVSTQEVNLTSKYDNTHHCLPESLLCLGRLKTLHIRFPSLTSIQAAISKLTALERLRIEGLQGALAIEPGAKNSISLQPVQGHDSPNCEQGSDSPGFPQEASV